MSSEEIAIKVDNVSKNFILPHEKVNSVKGLFTSATKRKAKKSSEIQHALKDISFEVKKGEFFGIVGRNGSGKSTLLKILAGIYQPSSGAIQTHGKLVPFIELGVGFNPELTGRENVYLNGALLGFSDKEIDIMYEDIVAFAELERFMDQKLKNYSSGMQVRLAFSMATRSEADILLIDEVLAVGDADFQRKCFEYFKKLKKDKKTIIFVSHDMEAIREYCDRALLIDEHKVAQDSSPEQVAEEYIKLFNSNYNQVPDGSQEQQRWGSGVAKYKNVVAKVSKDTVTIEAHVEGKEELGHPIFGVLITNELGETVCGTNTKIVRSDTGTLMAGETRKISWEVPNIFSTGHYQVDVAATYQDGVTQADWWHGATSFSVVNKESTPHIVSPTISLLD